MSEKEKTEIPQVGPIDPNQQNSPIEEGPHPEGQDKGGDCWLNGKRYRHGEYVCSNGHLLCCWNSRWNQSGGC